MTKQASDTQKIRLREYVQLGVYALRTTWRFAPWYAAVSVFEAVLNGVVPIASAYLSGQLVLELSRTLDGTASFVRAIVFIMLIAGLSLFSHTFSSLKRALFSAKQSYISLMLSRELIYAQAYMALDQVELPETRDQFDRAKRGASSMNWYIDRLLEIVRSVISVVGVAGVILVTFPVIIFVLIPVVCLSAYYKNRELKQFRDEWQSTRAHRQRAWGVEETFSRSTTILEVRLLDLTRQLLDLWFSESKKSEDLHTQNEQKNVKITIVSSIAESTVGVVADIWVLTQLFAGLITVASFEQTRSLVASFISSVSSLANNVSGLSEDAFSVRDYVSFVSYGSVQQEIEGKTAVERFELIELSGVSYTYPSADSPALQRVSMSLRKGEKVAIVGVNGAGKSTLVKVLLGMYKPVEGAVLLNGRSSAEAHMLAGNASVIMQDFGLFDFLTFGEAVGLSDYPRYNKKRAVAALKSVGLYDYIQSVGGLDRGFGYVDDDGVKLSGGQNQRLALARALYASDELLVLDEPTSMIDAKDEQEIIDAILEQYAERTLLLVSHKVSTVKRADKIVVLKDGRVVESGTHKELYRKGTEYYEIFHKQIKAYAE